MITRRPASVRGPREERHQDGGHAHLVNLDAARFGREEVYFIERNHEVVRQDFTEHEALRALMKV